MSAVPASNGIIGGAVSDIRDAASQVIKTARNIRGSEAKTPVGRIAGSTKLAKAYEEKKYKKFAQARAKAEWGKKASLGRLYCRK